MTTLSLTLSPSDKPFTIEVAPPLPEDTETLPYVHAVCINRPRDKAKSCRIFQAPAHELESKAIQDLLKSAERTTTLFFLYDCDHQGEFIGTPESEEATRFVHLSRECRKGVTDAMDQLALLYLFSKDLPNPRSMGTRLLTFAARRGSSYAQFMLASNYFDGEHSLFPSESEALRTLLQSAKRGQFEAETLLVDLLAKQTDAASQTIFAIKYFDTQLNEGADQAKLLLAEALLYPDKGIAQSLESGTTLMCALAARDVPESDKVLNRSLFSPEKIPLDEAESLLRWACDEQAPGAPYTLALFLTKHSRTNATEIESLKASARREGDLRALNEVRGRHLRLGFR